jgi:hypothetical protein
MAAFLLVNGPVNYVRRLWKNNYTRGDSHWPKDGWLTKLFLASDCHLGYLT